MFESAEIGHSVADEVYKENVPTLREALLAAQFDFTTAKKFPVIVIVGGVDGAGKGETVNLLSEWMDARHIQTRALGEPTTEELDRPTMWRFWRQLPPKGKIGVFFGAWHTQPILRRAYGEIGNAELDHACDEIVRFERMLAAEGALILKFWFHLSKKRQKKRLKSLAKDKKTRWRVTKTDWKHFELYDTFREVSERALRRTSTAEAPWVVVEGTDPNYRYLTVGQAILDALKRRLATLDAPKVTPPVIAAEPVAAPAVDGNHLLRSLDLNKSLSPEEYDERLTAAERKLSLLSRHKRFRKHSVIAAFEGSDAAGKGGAIRRLAATLDARQYSIVPIAAPTEEERAQPYLWRFWRHIPGKGRFTIYDRSWYGRVLVERVEGFCGEADWRRAYEEINDFEEQLVRNGAVVSKFWLQIDKETQLARFQEREQTGFKHYKITAEDWRNRDKWDAYEVAVGEMVDRTSTEIAPWTLVEANDKHYARVKVLETLADRLEAALDR
ncbi:MAG TPA: polyphosphate:AMP phosphotransferase [Planctomycetota bacterium]|nr:polyphosphate:AMP phosphotransferase [Planctomycetota bacterium]